MRPCTHAVAVIKVDSAQVGLPQCQNGMHHLWLGTVWHLHTWRAQHTEVIKLVSLAGHAEQLKRENLIPTRMNEPAVPTIAFNAANVSCMRRAI